MKQTLNRAAKLGQWEKRDMGYETPCHYWLGATSRSSHGTHYGRVWYAGRYQRAHRVIWELEMGPLRREIQLHHICGVSRCVNVAHLAPLTHGEHVRADRTKLTPEAVKYIRTARKSGVAVAKELGISASLVSGVRTRALWDDVD